MYNQNNLLKKLYELYDIYRTKGDQYRQSAYYNAYYIIKHLDYVPKTYSELKKISGIGKSIADKIVEYFNTGQIQLLNELKQQQKYITELTSIKGIGVILANTLIQQNITSISKLKLAFNQQKVKLNNTQYLGLKYYKDLKTKIPRKEIEIFESKLKPIFKKIELKFKIMGSYRRGELQSHDIDILIYDPYVETKSDIKHNYIKEVIDELHNNFKFIAKFSQGNVKFSGLYILHKVIRQIDILFVPIENLYTAINYFTGSKEHNIKLREYAKKKGYKVSEYWLKKDNQIIKLKSERDLFDKIGFPYVPPNKR